ncbi:hypothetical protein RB201_04855 [Streptomyces sp. S1A(2023)]
MFALLLLGVAWAAGTTVRERREGVRREVVAAAERAKIEERLRIARDIHRRGLAQCGADRGQGIDRQPCAFHAPG